MLKSIGLASFKGGVGKTMIAYSLAERATASGLRVMLLDFDPNEGPMALATLRDYNLPTWSMSSVPLTASGLRALEDHLKSENHDLVICDLPGADSTLFLRLLGNLDLVLSPLGPGVSDLFVAAEFAATLQRFNLPGWLVGNTLQPGKARREEFAASLHSYDYINLCPVQVVNRVAHIDAARRGLSACEWDPNGQAANEINELWSWVSDKLELSTLALVA